MCDTWYWAPSRRITSRTVVSRIGLVLVAAGAAAALALSATSATPGQKQTCFGAAARDPHRTCANRDLQLAVVPTPAQARDLPNAPCTIVESDGPFRVCEFGTTGSDATDTVALLGDSHAAHWRAALEVVAKNKHWRGLSLTLSGCPFSTATRVLQEPLRADCVRRNQLVPRWFERHPEISTVFVSELSGAQWMLPRGGDAFDEEVAAYTDAWSELPPSVRHIVVIRDTPKDRPGTQACIERAIAARTPAGQLCAVPRRIAIDRDAAAVAASRLPSGRAQVLDLNRFFCSDRWCYPIIGGALVHKDEHHLTAIFDRTLGPYLLRDVNRLMAGWT
jgi:SGNH domain (fused to AT3 domains)